MKIHVSISKKNKLSHIFSINSYVGSNLSCKKMYSYKNNICHYCYAIYLHNTVRQNCIGPFKRNDELLTVRLLDHKEIPFLNMGVCRFNSWGELHNDIHFQNYCRIAEVNKVTSFSLYTKRPDIVIRNIKYKPDNLLLIYSSPKINRIAKRPKHFDKVFTIFTNSYADKNNVKINCIGKCYTCLKCYDKLDTSININEIEKVLIKKCMDKIRSKIKWEV